uniref:THAP domain containing 6 n=1 Tax=Iconisemion striatum TaxID=60296 RepID=A0A1A7WBI5_9TELE
MPDFCAAYGCSNRRCVESRQRGITFHSFPKDGERRRQWEVALRRENFVVNNRTMICSEHFKAEDFDRTGQTVRLKAGVGPTIFCFPAHLHKVVPTISTATFRRADDNLDVSLDEPKLDELGAMGERHKEEKQQATDHTYGFPSCPKSIKAKLDAASARVRKLEREKSNSIKRERRAKKCIQSLLKELEDKNLITEELNDNLERYSGFPVHLLPRQGVDYTQDQREFALTLHLHGPKAYNYLRETLKIHLPHPSSLQRWLSSVDSKPGLNKRMLDML